MDAKGNIKTDEFQNTSAANIYAVGDVIGKWQLTPGMISSVARTTKCSQLFWKSAY